MKKTDFTDTVWQRGHELYRNMPWREDVRPYYVLVSELRGDGIHYGREV